MRLAVRERREISVRGIVQGVGFRPFIYALARRHGLSGVVRNDAEGVRIEVEGSPEELERFLRGITEEAPPLAVVEAVGWRPLPVRGEREFRIEESREGLQRRALVSPDVATCEECLSELFDPADRRYRYPFINCTNCGPRFTITRSVPYDRAMTTMARFRMCPECQREYDDPSDRRFHAQPNACPVCGPRVRLLGGAGRELEAEAPILKAARLVRRGAILAVKGLGGYHLACGGARHARTSPSRSWSGILNRPTNFAA
jgi:hydrogenase maturation protein HypF